MSPFINSTKCLLIVHEQDDPGAGLLLAELLSWGVECDYGQPDEVLQQLRLAAGNSRPIELLLFDIDTAAAVRLAQTIGGGLREPPKMVLLTLAGPGGNSQECREAGILALLPKPVDQDRLYLCLTNVLGSAKPVPAVPRLPDVKRPRILVVDDDEINQISAVRLLKKLDVDADVAKDGVRAVEAYRNSSYDLILMDCEMPRMNGFAATAQIRADEADSGVRRMPIVAVTANAIRGERERCLAAGMDDYITKPVRFAQLRETVARWTDLSVLQPDLLPRSSMAGDGIDYAVLDEIREVDRDLVIQLCRAFTQDTVEQLNDLQKNCEAGNVMAAGQLAHRIRGSCLTIGVNGMAEMCSEIESAAKLEDLQRCEQFVAQVQREFQRAVRELQAYNASHLEEESWH
jgi:two-component system, sensor histidine kinase and response regulator